MYQPAMETGVSETLSSSNASMLGRSVCVKISLITTTSVEPVPDTPGEPPNSLLFRQFPARVVITGHITDFQGRGIAVRAPRPIPAVIVFKLLNRRSIAIENR